MMQQSSGSIGMRKTMPNMNGSVFTDKSANKSMASLPGQRSGSVMLKSSMLENEKKALEKIKFR